MNYGSFLKWVRAIGLPRFDSAGRLVDGKGRAFASPKPTNVATRSIVQGPYATGSHGVPRNTHLELTTEVDFDAARLVLFSTNPAAQTGIAASLGVGGASVGSSAAAMNALAVSSFVNVTWAAASTVTQAAGSSTAPSVTVSDWMDLSSVPRTDGGAFPLLHVRVYQPSANSNISYRGGAADGGSSDQQWRMTASDGRTLCFFYKDGADYTTGMPTWNSGAVVAPRLVPFAIQYKARTGRITTLFVIGDSISYGQGGAHYGEGYTTLLHRALSSASRRVEFANFGWPGQTTTTYLAFLQSLITAGIYPQGWTIFHTFSPNDTPGTGTDLTASIIATMRRNAVKAVDAITTNNGVPFLALGIPENTAAKGWPSDSLRVAYNAATAAYQDACVLDIATPLNGVTTGGQVQIAAGLANADGLHPSDAGHAAMFAGIDQTLFR